VAVRNLSVYYDSFQAVKDVTLEFPQRSVTALIGPSGCGKSTLLRCINRMNDFVDGCRIEGEVLLENSDLYDPHIRPQAVRSRIGMVFQKPNPIPTSIERNIL